MNYEINEGTLALIADGESKSKILEDDKIYYVENTPYEILDHSCKYFGSSYEGRREGSKEILNANYKVPIVVENSKNLIFFPTNSPQANDCSWISLKDIKLLEEVEYNMTKITFFNNTSITLPVSKRTVENQVFRASRLDLILRNRRNQKNS